MMRHHGLSTHLRARLFEKMSRTAVPAQILKNGIIRNWESIVAVRLTPGRDAPPSNPTPTRSVLPQGAPLICTKALCHSLYSFDSFDAFSFFHFNIFDARGSSP
jgi:hypothetical protein